MMRQNLEIWLDKMTRNGTIRKLADDDFDAFIRVLLDAYPGMLPETGFSEERKKQWKERMIKENNEDPTMDYFGYFLEEKLIGGMLFHNFNMNIYSTITEVGGVGEVCVDLLHKKEHVAKEMMKFFHEYYLQKGSCLTTLYPFRPDFYMKMGYGLGSKMNQYSFKAKFLPRFSKDNVEYLDSSESTMKLVADCFNRCASQKHGMILRPDDKFDRFLKSFKVIGYRKNNQILGYLIFYFKKLDKDNFLRNNIIIRELVYESPEALLGLLTFLNTQNDQINKIIFNTPDNHFHHLLSDPRSRGNENLFFISQESNIQGVGIMYRVINTSKLFDTVLKDHNFGNQDLRLKITLIDTFLPSNNGSLILEFIEGKPMILEDDANFDVEIKLDIGTFSSLVMGVINFKTVYLYGKAEISNNNYVHKINTLFQRTETPFTIEDF